MEEEQEAKEQNVESEGCSFFHINYISTCLAGTTGTSLESRQSRVSVGCHLWTTLGGGRMARTTRR